MSNKVTMKTCEVGVFKLPGVVFDKGDLTEAQAKEIKAWIEDNKCGYFMNNELWSFKTTAQRDWFILRWCDLDSSKQE
jgi:hypothetical protein